MPIVKVIEVIASSAKRHYYNYLARGDAKERKSEIGAGFRLGNRALNKNHGSRSARAVASHLKTWNPEVNLIIQSEGYLAYYTKCGHFVVFDMSFDILYKNGINVAHRFGSFSYSRTDSIIDAFF